MQRDHRCPQPLAIATDGDHEWSGDVSRWRSDYEGLIVFARPRVAEWAAEPLTDADHARWAER